MMNQDQYHASLLNKGQPVGLGWDGITKATQPKVYPAEPPNDTDVDKTIQMVKDDDHELLHLNWNNIRVCFQKLNQLLLYRNLPTYFIFTCSLAFTVRVLVVRHFLINGLQPSLKF